MKLDINRPIKYLNSAHRHFYEGERHITRVCKSSVLLLVYKSTLRFGEGGEQIEVKSGEYYIQRAGLPQNGLVPSDKPEYYYIHFEGEFSDGEGIPIRGEWHFETISPFIEEMEGDKSTGEMLLQKSLAFYKLLDELYRKEKRGVSPLAKDIMSYINERYRERISVKELAKRFYISENHFIKVFRMAYGITPYKYVTKRRLDKAAELLRETDRTEEAIALSIGFYDFSVFYKAFLAEYGVAPSVIRKKIRQSGKT